MGVKLTAPLVRSFTELFLITQYDNPKPIPDLHDELWEECCSDDPWVADAAPREHAKSTAVTHAFTLCAVLFRARDHVLLVSDTEKQACDFLGDIKAELLENENLKEQFGIKKFIKDTESEIIVQFDDGERFRIIVKGSEQKVRGIKWRNKRPNLIMVDDFENDESVMNPDRREKSRNWFQKALIPCGSDNCIVRVVGTILHLDSMLNRLMDNPEWRTKKFAAHGRDFSDILWPEKFPEWRLRKIRSAFDAEGNLDGYNQEYLNNPIAEGNTYFRPQDFIAMDDPDYETHKVHVASADMAIAENERADYTVMMVGGIDVKGVIHILDVRRDRIGSKEIIDEMISIGKRYNPDPFIVETEKIDKAIGPFLNDEMRRTGVFLNIVKKTPSKSKTTRGKSIQAMMRSGSVRFDMKADWYPDVYAELMTMTPAGSKGKHDDIFDAFAYIGLAVNEFQETPTPEELEEESWDEEYADDIDLGICAIT